MTKGYSAVWKILSRYWKLYGGLRALFLSPYFHASILLTAIIPSLWKDDEWWSLPLQVMPNIVGFSLGGYAIWLAIGDEKFRAIISGDKENGTGSPFMSVNATFVHFILCQFFAIVLAIIGKGNPIKTFIEIFEINNPCFLETLQHIGMGYRAFSYFVFIYAIFTAIAATFAIFQVGSWYDTMQTKNNLAKQNLSEKNSNSDNS